MRFSHVCFYVIEEGPVVDDDYGGAIGGMTTSITSGLEAMNGASVQHRSHRSGTVASLSDQFAGFWGAVVSDYTPEKFSRMVQEY